MLRYLERMKATFIWIKDKAIGNELNEKKKLIE